jgi:hypothetical protein
MKQTAVEWLMSKLQDINPTQIEWHEAIEQALEFEKQKEQQLNKSLAFCRLFIETCEGGMPHDRDLKSQAIEVINNSNLD